MKFLSTIRRRSAVLLVVFVLASCQSTPKPDYSRNISAVERSLIDAINRDGPGDRFVINRVNVSDEVVDRFTISMTQGTPYTALSESGSPTVGNGSVVEFCGWGEFLGMPIYTESPYICRAGEGLVFGVTSQGWVHLYGTGEIAGTRISKKKPN